MFRNNFFRNSEMLFTRTHEGGWGWSFLGGVEVILVLWLPPGRAPFLNPQLCFSLKISSTLPQEGTSSSNCLNFEERTCCWFQGRYDQKNNIAVFSVVLCPILRGLELTHRERLTQSYRRVRYVSQQYEEEKHVWIQVYGPSMSAATTICAETMQREL